MSTVQLHLGDCLEFMRTLPAGSVDAVITDPPYGVNYRQGGGHGVSPKWTKRHVNVPIVGDNGPFDPNPFLGFSTVILFGANNFADKLPASRGWVCWDKKCDLGSNDFADGELIWTNRNAVMRMFRHRWSGVIRDSENGQRAWHPTQKPVALMEWILRNYTSEGDTIFDPFMGSGTTGVAAVKLGRNFIGCEIEPKYYEIAQRRIADAQQQMVMAL